jgi:glutamyl-tRNA reductase
MHLLLFGVNHHTASLEDREALAFNPEQTSDLLARLGRCGNLREIVLLSTCNRTEFYVVASDIAGAEQHLRDSVLRLCGRDLLGPGPQRTTAVGVDVARHLLRVACGLDSMVLGDVQILGQVKDAHVLAREVGTVGPWLDRLFDTALHAGKRARSETSIGAGTVSMASAAVELAVQITASLAERHVLVVGAGDTARRAAQHAAEHGAARLSIANRTRTRAEAVAAEIGGVALDLTDIPDALAAADVVISATRAASPVITTAMLQHALARRDGRPILVVDLAMPRDVEPAAAEVPGVVLHPIDSIQSVVDRHLAARLSHVPAVEAIVNDEAHRFAAWIRSLGAKTTVVALRDHFERIRVEEVDRQLAHASPEERERAERLTRALINRLLHVPTLRLKDADPSSDDGLQRLQAAQELFALGGEDVTDRRRRANA